MDLENLEKSVLTFDDNLDGNIRLRPEIYIHNNLLMAQRVLLVSVLKDNIKEGIFAYKMFIESIESIMRSAKWLNDKELKVEISNEIKNDVAKEGAIANKKLQLLMQNAFERSQLGGSIKLGSR